MFIHSSILIHSFIHSSILMHSFIHSFIHSYIHPIHPSITYAIAASQCFASRHEVVVVPFDMSSDRLRLEGRPAKGLRPPRVKQSQGEVTETSPSGPARPRSEMDRDVSTFSRSILTPSQTHRISIEERPSGRLSLSNGSDICREVG